MQWALIKDEVVVNIIEAAEAYILTIQSQYDATINITDMAGVYVGCGYLDGEFVINAPKPITIHDTSAARKRRRARRLAKKDKLDAILYLLGVEL